MRKQPLIVQAITDGPSLMAVMEIIKSRWFAPRMIILPDPIMDKLLTTLHSDKSWADPYPFTTWKKSIKIRGVMVIAESEEQYYGSQDDYYDALKRQAQ